MNTIAVTGSVIGPGVNSSPSIHEKTNNCSEKAQDLRGRLEHIHAAIQGLPNGEHPLGNPAQSGLHASVNETRDVLSECLELAGQIEKELFG